MKTNWIFAGNDHQGRLKTITVRSKHQNADTAKRAFQAAEQKLQSGTIRLLRVTETTATP